MSLAAFLPPARGQGPGYRLAVVGVSGPSSYSAGGFTVSIPELRRVVAAIVQASGGYKAEVASVSGNTVTVKVYYYDYDASADGPAVEVPDGTDLSGVTFTIVAIGE